jgi:ABC-type sulfate transport system permease component
MRYLYGLLTDNKWKVALAAAVTFAVTLSLVAALAAAVVAFAFVVAVFEVLYRRDLRGESNGIDQWLDSIFGLYYAHEEQEVQR